MTGYTILPLDLGRAHREKSFFTYMTDVGQSVELAMISFLVRGNGHTMLIDTGAPAVAKTAPWHLPYEQSPEQTLPAQLAQHGVSPSEIDIVIFTHLHWDHCYNVELFPQAHFFVRRRELEFAKHPVFIHHRMYDAPSTGVKAPYLDLDFHFNEDEQEIVPGIRVFPTPGHTPGHQSVAVETAAGRQIIAGDITPLYENWDRQIPNGMLSSLEDCHTSFGRLKEMGGTIWASHDPKTLSRSILGSEK